MKYVKYMSLIALSLLAIDLLVNHKNTANFKVNECGANILFPGIRKIKSIDTYMYNYVILGDNSNKYSMRINDFDRIMEPIKCKEIK